MTKPIIEHKHRQPRPRQDTTISLLEARLTRGESEAQKMVCALADAMVRCGYTRDGVYNSRLANYSGKRERATVIIWRNGKILLGRGLKKERDGTPERTKHGAFVPNDPDHPRNWSAHDLINVAHHLAPFLDALENNVRWQVEQLEKAVETIQAVLDRVEADPRPSDEPAQMSEDPDAPVA